MKFRPRARVDRVAARCAPARAPTCVRSPPEHIGVGGSTKASPGASARAPGRFHHRARALGRFQRTGRPAPERADHGALAAVQRMPASFWQRTWRVRRQRRVRLRCTDRRPTDSPRPMTDVKGETSHRGEGRGTPRRGRHFNHDQETRRPCMMKNTIAASFRPGPAQAVEASYSDGYIRATAPVTRPRWRRFVTSRRRRHQVAPRQRCDYVIRRTSTPSWPNTKA